MNKVKQAEECFQQALKLDPQSDEALVGLAAINFFRLNRKKTLEYAQDAWQIDKTNIEAADFVKKASHFWLFYISCLYRPLQMAIDRLPWEKWGFEPENIEAYAVIYALTFIAIIALHLISAGLAFVGLSLPAAIVAWLLYPAYAFFGFSVIAILFEYGKRLKGEKKEAYTNAIVGLLLIYVWIWLLIGLGGLFNMFGGWLLETILVIFSYLTFLWIFSFILMLAKYQRTPGEKKKPEPKLPKLKKKKRKRGEPVIPPIS